MAYEECVKSISIEASADLSASQYRFVSVNANGQIARTGNGAPADGVLQDKPAAQGRPGQVAVDGVSKMLIGTGGVSAGDDIASDADGQAVTAASGDVVQGTAMADASAGSLGPVLLRLGNANPPA